MRNRLLGAVLLASISTIAHAQTSISALPAATAPAGTDVLPLYQGTGAKKVTVTQIGTAALGQIGSLPAATTVTGSESVPVVQGGIAKTITVGQIGSASAVSAKTYQNAQTYTGSDFGAQVNSALATTPTNGSIAAFGPSDGNPQSFATTVTLGTNQSLVSPHAGGKTPPGVLTYTGSGTAFNLTGQGSAFEGGSLSLGSNALIGLNIAGGSQSDQLAHDFTLSGGGTGTVFVREGPNVSGLRVQNATVNRATDGSIGFQLSNSNDNLIQNVKMYGAKNFCTDGTNTCADTSSISFDINSHAYGTVLDNVLGGYSGGYGIYVRNTINTAAGYPAELYAHNVYIDCTNHSGILYDSTITGGVRSMFVGDWSAGAGQECATSSLLTHNAHGVELNGAVANIGFIGGRFRANTGAGFYNNSTGRGVMLTASSIVANGYQAASDLQNGITETSNVNGFGVIGNFIGNDTDVSNGHQQYSISIGATTGYGLVMGNVCSGAEASGQNCVKQGEASGAKIAYIGNVTNVGQFDVPNKLYGDLRQSSDGSPKVGAHLMPSYGAGNNSWMGATANLYYDPVAATFATETDGGSNGGAGFLCSNNPTSTSGCGLYVVPSSGTTAQTITAANMVANNAKLLFPAGVPTWQGLFNALGDGTYSIGSGASAGVGFTFAGRGSIGFNSALGATQWAAAGGKQLVCTIGGSFTTTSGIVCLIDASGNFGIGPATTVGSDPFQVSQTGQVMANTLALVNSSQPTLSNCGTSPSLESGASDSSFVMVVGTGGSTTCQATFAVARTTRIPTCTWNRDDGVALAGARSLTGVSFTSTATMAAGTKINVMCVFKGAGAV